MEPVTGAAAKEALSAAEKSWITKALLGPTLQSMGEDLNEKYRTWNRDRMLRKAARRAGDSLEQPGQVHPRVAHRLLEEGSYVTDDVMLEYLAGMLAAARTPDGRDDRGAYFANLVSSLTANQIRLHHAICSALATVVPTEQDSLGDQETLDRYAIYTPMMLARQLLEGPGDEDDVASPQLVGETVVSLHREGLVSYFALGRPALIDYDGFDVPVLMAVPSTLALHVFLWAYGIRDGQVDQIARCLDLTFDPPGPVFSEYKLDVRRSPVPRY